MAVRPLAEVAARIPEKPANTEATAPAKKAMAVLVSLMNANKAPTATQKIASTLYSAKRNAMAPL